MTDKTSPNPEKPLAELDYWMSRPRIAGRLTNDHFEYFFTEHFGFGPRFYRGKRVLDVGCGPRGSLEWATEASLRVGIDPLAAEYLELGAREHQMRYITCTAEQMPFADASFDVVSSFNSLDHVDDLLRTAHEIVRVLAPRGFFILLADVHVRPTVMEPAAFSWNVIERFLPALKVVTELRVEQSVFSPEGYGDIYQSLRRGVPYDNDNETERTGILSVKFVKLERFQTE